MNNLVIRFVREEGGQDLVEYALLSALIAIACMAGVTQVATGVNTFLASVGRYFAIVTPT